MTALLAPDMTAQALLARWSGFCGACGDDRPLLLSEQGGRGLRAWLCGLTPQDRELSLACGLCGDVQPVPADEQLDAVYDATLPRWPDLVWDLPETPVLEDAVVEHPVVEHPVVEHPVVEHPVVEHPVVEHAVMEEAVLEQAVFEDAVSWDQVEELPVAVVPVALPEQDVFVQAARALAAAEQTVQSAVPTPRTERLLPLVA